MDDDLSLNALRRPTRCLRIMVELHTGSSGSCRGNANNLYQQQQQQILSRPLYIRHSRRAKMDAWKDAIVRVLGAVRTQYGAAVSSMELQSKDDMEEDEMKNTMKNMGGVDNSNECVVGVNEIVSTRVGEADIPSVQLPPHSKSIHFVSSSASSSPSSPYSSSIPSKPNSNALTATSTANITATPLSNTTLTSLNDAIIALPVALNDSIVKPLAALNGAIIASSTALNAVAGPLTELNVTITDPASASHATPTGAPTSASTTAPLFPLSSPPPSTDEIEKLRASLKKLQQRDRENKERQLLAEERHRRECADMMDQIQDAVEDMRKIAEEETIQRLREEGWGPENTESEVLIKDLKARLAEEEGKNAVLQKESIMWKEAAGKALTETVARIKAERELEEARAEKDLAIGDYPSLKLKHEELWRKHLQLIKDYQMVKARLEKETTVRKRVERALRQQTAMENISSVSTGAVTIDEMTDFVEEQYSLQAHFC